jgi:hypothetical protein
VKKWIDYCLTSGSSAWKYATINGSENIYPGKESKMARSAVKTKTEVGKLLGNTRNLLEDIRKSRRETVNQLRKDLAQSRSSVKSDVRQMLNRFHKTRQDLGGEFKKARAVRQESASTKHLKSRAVETPLKSETSAAEGEIHEEEMLSVINKHPEGINMAGIAERLGVAPVVLGRASKSLQDKGGVRKEGKLYFPVDGKKEAGQGLHFRPPLR